MPDQDIANDETENIINLNLAEEIADPTTEAIAVIIYTDGDIRLVSEEEREQASAGIPIKSGSYWWNFDPRGLRWYAYNDESSGSVTVNTSLQKFAFIDGGGPA